MNFKNYESLIAGIGGLLGSYLFWIAQPMLLLPFWIPVIITIILIALIWYMVIRNALYQNTLKNLKGPLIKIIDINNNGDILFRSNALYLFQYDTYITVYITDNKGFQKLYGIAKVTNIQEKNIIQASIIKRSNQSQSTSNIKVLSLLPTLTKESFDLLINYQNSSYESNPEYYQESCR